MNLSPAPSPSASLTLCLKREKTHLGNVLGLREKACRPLRAWPMVWTPQAVRETVRMAERFLPAYFPAGGFCVVGWKFAYIV